MKYFDLKEIILVSTKSAKCGDENSLKVVFHARNYYQDVFV
jgi:hypothetical protein